MYISSRHESKSSLNIKIPWDSNTARGFLLALIIISLILLISPWFELVPAKPHNIPINTIPLEILNFGLGDGTGMSKGNLTQEGSAHKGKETQSILEDAQKSAQTRLDKNANNMDLESTNNYIASKELSADAKSNDKFQGSDRRNTGTREGTDDGSGLGTSGIGKGKGYGFGDIEWGGGGNRIVLYKKIPIYPEGVNTSAQIKLRFTVQSDGTVSSVIPLQKADPLLERAAIEALKQWRFNPLKEDVVMVGIIPMTFQLR